MVFRSSPEENGDPVVAAEGSARSWTSPKKVPVAFLEDWWSYGAIPGDGGHRTGEEDGKVVKQHGAEVSTRWRKHDPSSISANGSFGDQRPLHLVGGERQRRLPQSDSLLMLPWPFWPVHQAFEQGLRRRIYGW